MKLMRGGSKSMRLRPESQFCDAVSHKFDEKGCCAFFVLAGWGLWSKGKDENKEMSE